MTMTGECDSCAVPSDIRPLAVVLVNGDFRLYCPFCYTD